MHSDDDLMTDGLDSAYLIDVDGTLIRGECAIPGAIEFIDRLNTSGKPYLIASNNSTRTKESYVERLRRIGFDVDASHILTAVDTTILYLERTFPEAEILPICDPGLIAILEGHGFSSCRDDPDVVLLGLTRDYTVSDIDRAVEAVEGGASLIAANSDMTLITDTGPQLDTGFLIESLFNATSVRAFVTGKPNTLFWELAQPILGVKPREATVIGDRIYTDRLFAKNIGASFIAVLTGEITRETAISNGYRFAEGVWELDRVSP